MHDTDYAYAVANIRANELKLLTKADLAALISAPSAAEAVRFLRDKGYGGSERFDTEDQMLAAQRDKILAYVRELAGDSGILDVFCMRNDFQNLKALIKAKVTGIDPGLALSPGLIAVPELQAALDGGDFSALPEWIRAEADHAYQTAAETGDGQLSDILLDKALLRQMQTSPQAAKNPFIAELFGKTVALYNIKTALRACKAKKGAGFVAEALVPCRDVDVGELADRAADMESLLEYIKTTAFAKSAEIIARGLSAFEKYCDDLLTEHTKTVKYNAFGAEPLIAYLLCNETEQKNVRIILAGKRGGIPAENIAERMRETYV